MVKSVFNLLFLVIYLLSAAVQYNDPDALLWILFYLSATVMCIAQHIRRQSRWLPPLLLVISLLWIGSLLPGIAGQVSWSDIFESITMRTRAVEEAREIGGLLLVSLWSGYLAFRRAGG